MTDTRTTPLPFPLATGREKGYEREAVDRLLAEARSAFEQQDEGASFDADRVRAASFALTRGGYRIDAVDAALARVEDAFAAREREQAIAATGPEAWVSRARADAQTLLDRLTRPEGQRFDRVGFLRFGYARVEVEIVADRLVGFLARGEALSVEQIRQSAFRMTRNGYREEQVDAVLDAAVDVLLAVR
ncbi:DivIVA domain-containing protein [Microbacterium betulae]|uniref:DivIVA domain-containing protein n=1 Tax=Microbacterium betulae TaxID=2981139 RepID=A0AA97FES8_9MICO|nr:DivIVA domain-containing protein [Microbacterium sp. AB]WOF21568.1 DivIVA domain-containing protein [Microbacterium sp. AB]